MTLKQKVKINSLKNSIFLKILFGVVLIFSVSLISRAEEPPTSVLDTTPSDISLLADDPQPPPEDPAPAPSDSLESQPAESADQAPVDDATTPSDASEIQETVAPQNEPPPEDPAPAPSDPLENQPPANAEEAPVNDDATTPPDQEDAPAAEAPETQEETTTPPDAPVPEAETPPQIVIQQPAPTPEPPPPQPEIIIPKKYLSFGLESQPLATRKDLPWLPAKFKAGEGEENREINIGISNDDPSKLIFSGSCSKTFFVILAFGKANDYIDDPGRFIYNKAFSCKNGGYYYELDDLSKDLPDGVYYFMVAEEGLTGPWQPTTAIQPIRITSEYK